MSNQENIYTLFELNRIIRDTIDESLPSVYFVVAEIAELRFDGKKGHCYIELIERNDDEPNPIAKMKATIWSYTYRNISQKFQKETGEPLKKGLKVLLHATISFHELYGLSLNIKDIDVTYSLGEMAKKRKEIIERLKKEGLIDLNKSLTLSLVPQRIAIVSSAAAAGYDDFINHLAYNRYGYRFSYKLYEAVMQGAESGQSITEALNQINKQYYLYDVAIIIRGGGSQIDLSCFDSYEIASAIARSRLPVLTGIGHERDDTISDIVAHTKLKTPTAVAEFLISGVRAFEERVLHAQRVLIKTSERLLKEHTHILNRIIQNFIHSTKQRLQSENSHIKISLHKLSHGVNQTINKKTNAISINNQKLVLGVKSFIQNEQGRMFRLEQAITLLNPLNILKRGYSITSHKGKAVKSISLLNTGDIIETRVYDGILKSKVEGKNGNV